MPTTFLSKKDNAKSTLLSAITAVATSFEFQAGHGTRFPSGNFVVTIWDATSFPDPSDDSQMEKILVVTRSTDSAVTVTRGYDSSTAVSHSAGSAVRLLDVRKWYDEYETAITALEGLTHPSGTFAVGDLLYASTSAQLSRLAVSATTNQLLGVTGGLPAWVNPLGVAAAYVVGDIIYASSTSAFSKLAIGGTGAVLKVSSGLPAWLARGSANQVLKTNSGGTDIAWADQYGAASIVIGETPTGAVNGSNAAYTLAATQATGSLEVFKNGVRMTASGGDYTESSGGFTMVTAPATGTILRVNYYKTVDFAVVGTNSLVEDETPTGTVNGSNTAFTVLKGSFIANSLAVYLNGQKLTHTADFTETTPGSGTFAFVTAPATGAVVRVGYQFVSNTSGNADTVDGVHADQLVQGWLPVTGTWTYASADAPTYVITVPSDATALYSPGMRVKLTHSAAVKYFIITAVSATTITVYGGTDYTLSASAFTNIYTSGIKAPLGFPLDPTKWTVETTSGSDATQASPVAGTWYNLGTLNIIIPIGIWRTYYEVVVNANIASGTSQTIHSTLSTANNSESDATMSAATQIEAGTAALRLLTNVHRERTLVLVAKTTYYLNAKSLGTTDSIGFIGARATTIIRSTSSYL